MTNRTLSELQAALAGIRCSPAERGRVELIVRRPASDERDILAEGVLDVADGLVGDNWRTRGSTTTPDGCAHPGQQVTLINVRVSSLVARFDEPGPDRRPLAGDQLHVDLDLSVANLPPGTRLAVGGAVLEVSGVPHRGCAKFVQRFGADAMRFVNSPVGAELNLRGINARVVTGGVVRQGDPVVRLPAAWPGPGDAGRSG